MLICDTWCQCLNDGPLSLCDKKNDASVHSGTHPLQWVWRCPGLLKAYGSLDFKFFPLNYVICIFTVCVQFFCVAMWEDRATCSMIMSWMYEMVNVICLRLYVSLNFPIHMKMSQVCHSGIQHIKRRRRASPFYSLCSKSRRVDIDSPAVRWFVTNAAAPMHFVSNTIGRTTPKSLLPVLRSGLTIGSEDNLKRTLFASPPAESMVFGSEPAVDGWLIHQGREAKARARLNIHGSHLMTKSHQRLNTFFFNPVMWASFADFWAILRQY